MIVGKPRHRSGTTVALRAFGSLSLVAATLAGCASTDDGLRSMAPVALKGDAAVVSRMRDVLKDVEHLPASPGTDRDRLTELLSMLDRSVAEFQAAEYSRCLAPIVQQEVVTLVGIRAAVLSVLADAIEPGQSDPNAAVLGGMLRLGEIAADSKLCL